MRSSFRGLVCACVVAASLQPACGSGDGASGAEGDVTGDVATDGSDVAADGDDAPPSADGGPDAPGPDGGRPDGGGDADDADDDGTDADVRVEDTDAGDDADAPSDADDEGDGTETDADADPDGDASVDPPEPNACGGDDLLVDDAGDPAEPGDPCGCDGEWVCDGLDALTCDDVDANACGGCAALGGVPGAVCGDCSTWSCASGGEAVACVRNETLPGCEPRVPVRCADLNCALQLRSCTDPTDGSDAACGACLPGNEDVGGLCGAALVPPTGVSASLGTSPDHVVITWQPVTGADGYHVHRGGVRITGSPTTALAWTDTGAPEPPVPLAPGGANATENLPNEVRVGWTAVSPRVGSGSVYTVTAVAGARESAPSASATGYRAAYPISGYEVQVDNGTWTSVGVVSSWVDVAAPAGRIESTDVNASTNLADRVNLDVVTPALTPGAARTYRVRARNAAGPSEPSAEVTGRRLPRDRSYEWQWATAITGPWSTLEGNVTRLAVDTTIRPGASRWYRVRISAEGAADRTAGPTQGTRFGDALAHGDACTTNSTCGGGNWCPTNASDRRCVPRFSIGSATFSFQWVPSGAFALGSPVAEVGRDSTNEGQVSVTIGRNLMVMRTEVTRAQWAEVIRAWNALPDAERTLSGWTGPTPAFATSPSWAAPGVAGVCTSDDCPVERVSWWDAVVFANILSRLEGRTPCYTLTGCGSGTGVAAMGGGCSGSAATCGSAEGTFSCTGASFVGVVCTGYRLPTEAEWELSTRGGTATATSRGNLSNLVNTCVNPPDQANLDPIARWCGNSFGGPRAAESLFPNAYGLYDVAGNVAEWTWNHYSATHAAGTNPLGPASGSTRTLRNGSWQEPANRQRSAARSELDPRERRNTVGFRLIRSGPL